MQPGENEGGGGGRTADRAGTIVLLALSGLIAVAMAFAGLMLVMSSDSCGSANECNYSLFTIAWLLSMAVPIVGFIATLVFTIVRLAANRSAFWIPIAGTAAFALGFAGAVAVAFQAVS